MFTSNSERYTMIPTSFIVILVLSQQMIPECSAGKFEDTMELLEYDYADQCEKLTEITRDFYKNPNEITLKARVEGSTEYGAFERNEISNLKHFTEYYGGDMERKLHLLTKIGNDLLPSANSTQIAKLIGRTELLLETGTIVCKNGKKECILNQRGVVKTLQISNDPDELENVWSNWQKLFAGNIGAFKNAKNLLVTAAELNGFSSPTRYWEMLVEYPDAYVKARALWEDIQPLYLKLHKFVGARLNKKYGLNNTATIPTYLLGSMHANDWSGIADHLLPHPQIYTEIKNNIIDQGLGGKKLYKSAAKLSDALGLGNFSLSFWEKSIFDGSCPSQLLRYCKDGNTEILTCNITSMDHFFEAHMFGLRIAHIQQIENNKEHTYAFTNANRQSVVAEAIAELGSTLSLYPEHLDLIGILSKDKYEAYKEQTYGDMTLLLLQALRILPALPYYLAADIWRLNQKTDEELSEDWWDSRKKFQKLSSKFRNESDYLSDVDIVKMNPYISKYLGAILQFQIIEVLRDQAFEGSSLIEIIKESSEFRSLLAAGLSQPWTLHISNHFSINEINANGLLSYFAPLEKYLDNAPNEQVTHSILVAHSVTPRIINHVSSPTKRSNIHVILNNATSQNYTTLEDSEILTDSEDMTVLGASKQTQYIIIGAMLLIGFAVIGTIVITKTRTKHNKEKMRNRRYQP